jgi:hypothetical protein
MFMYMSDPHIADEEWKLRRLILELHDSVARYRYLKDSSLTASDRGEAIDFKPQIAKLRELISLDEFFQKKFDDPKKQKEILSGKQLYADGLRGAVRSTGWDADQFYATYSALSMYSHSAPSSFYRYPDMPYYPILGLVPDDQYNVSAFALDALVWPLGQACERMMFQLYPHLFLKGKIKQ